MFNSEKEFKFLGIERWEKNGKQYQKVILADPFAFEKFSLTPDGEFNYPKVTGSDVKIQIRLKTYQGKAYPVLAGIEALN